MRPIEKLRILLADDSAMIRHLYSTALTRAGAVVTLADDGDGALCQWKAHLHGGAPFDVVIVDYAMPGVGGLHVAAALRDAGYDGPIIGVSAELSRFAAKQWTELGCDEVLRKGISLSEFVERIAAHAGRLISRDC